MGRSQNSVAVDQSSSTEVTFWITFQSFVPGDESLRMNISLDQQLKHETIDVYKQ